MKIISVKEDFFNLLETPNELLQNKDKNRPYLLVIRLKFKGKNHNFAIPFRSNIHQSAPKTHYFNLPPNNTTKPGKRHGLHYAKMFPVTKNYFNKYHVGLDQIIYINKIKENIDKIVKAAQAYLIDYQQNGKPLHSVDIDKVLEKI